MSPLGRLTFGLLTVLLASACQLTPNFETGYQFDHSTLRAQPPVGSLAVKRFEDARPPRRYSGAGLLLLTVVPLLPYVELDYERLEESIRIQSEGIEQSGRGITMGAEQKSAGDFEAYTYPASFPRAIAADLGATDLFTASAYVGTEAAADDRYLLEGTLRETPLDRTCSSYMLGAWGVLLWLVPIPALKTSAAVTVDLRFTDQRNGHEVWRGTLDGDVSRLITLYTSSAMVYGRGGAFSFELEPPPSDSRVNDRSLFSWHFEALRRAMLKARPEIAAALTRYETANP